MKRQKKRYLITSAQSCASPHKRFWEGLQHYAKVNNAEIIVLPMLGLSAEEGLDKIHKELKPYALYTGKRLNSNIAIKQFVVRPQQIDPLTGFNRFTGQMRSSLIIASPKQRLRPIPHSNWKFPRFLMTTGACTRPNYATPDNCSNAERMRLGMIAKQDHIYGAIIVEIFDGKMYHFRHIRANSSGEFVDLGTLYLGSKTRKAKLEAMVLGDIHSGQYDPVVMETTYKMISELKPERLVLHDFFDGHSVSHHIEKKPIREKLIHIVDNGLHLLEVELKMCYEDLIRFSHLMCHRPIIIVNSNHHLFLARYLEEFRYRFEMSNFRVASKLAEYMSRKDYNDPVKAGLKMMGKVPKNVRFLREDDDYKVRGYQLGSHGDKSPTGRGYGSITSKENDFGKSITAHTHSAEMLRDTYIVGTCLSQSVFYMRGHPSKWTHTHALLYETGTVQLVHIFDGYWRMNGK